MLPSSIALAAASPPGGPSHMLGGANRPHIHTKPAGEVDEDHGPLLFKMTYTNDVMANVAGGRKRGLRHIDNLAIVFEADLEQLAGWQGGEPNLYGQHKNEIPISDIVTDIEALSNIETSYRIQLTPWFVLQPTARYIHRHPLIAAILTRSSSGCRSRSAFPSPAKSESNR
ncbi:MAG: hypothetical protein J0H88_03115 [Sphingomonadales bacterium]|nr:hypothetical protein [Sphingomonadales bacterium]